MYLNIGNLWASVEIELRVFEIPSTNQNDTGRGIVRIDTKSMRAIGVSIGDAVEIVGSKKTYAIVDSAYPSDIGLGIIRMDGLIRRNAGATIGEKVRVRPARVFPATKVVISPVGPAMVKINPTLLNKILRGRVMTKGDVIMLRPLPRALRRDYSEELEVVFPFFGPQMQFTVKEVRPPGGVLITPQTHILIEKVEGEVERRKPRVVTYEDIGGMKDVVQRIREIVELPLKHPELFARLGIEPPKGVLLYGPPGCGKTLLAKAVANETNAYFITINGPEIISKFAGEAEERLRRIFDRAKKNAPSIIFIDEIDAIAQKRDDLYGIEGRIVAQLLTLMDGLEERGQVIVIAATNRPEVLDPALRRPGRFDREISIAVPDRKGRKEILQIHTRGMPLADDVDLEKIAELTPGFTGADLAGLVREAALLAIRRILPKIDLDEEIPEDVLSNLKVNMQDFMDALKNVEPSALREVLVEIPKIRWEDIGGLEKVKEEIREAIELPLKEPEKFRKMGIKPPSGILLYGPPGCGKTLLVKAAANEANANFISVKGPEILSKWVGESERAVREIFRKAKQLAPCIVFFDEIDAIAPVRGSDANRVTERVVNQLLTELDGIEKREGIIFVAATNRPDLLDPALLRPGRIDRFIYIPAPDREARLEILKVHTKNMPLKKVDLEGIAENTEYFSGADLEAVCREAAIFAMKEGRDYVTQKDFQRAIEKVGPSLNEKIIEFYTTVKQKFRTRLPKEQPTYFR